MLSKVSQTGLKSKRKSPSRQASILCLLSKPIRCIIVNLQNARESCPSITRVIMTVLLCLRSRRYGQRVVECFFAAGFEHFVAPGCLNISEPSGTGVGVWFRSVIAVSQRHASARVKSYRFGAYGDGGSQLSSPALHFTRLLRTP